MSVFDTLVGQRPAIERLQRAARGEGMTHAWLFTGPAGSGRSNAALAFAAALQCERGGCGECHSCVMAAAGSHPDIKRVRTERLVHRIEDMRDLVLQAALRPALGRYQVVVVEDADRLARGDDTRTGNSLLKAIEEPAPRTVWLLCAPTEQDMLPTIASRCRSIVLTTPSDVEVAGFLTGSLGVSEEVAAYAAHASQGHIGRARALAFDDDARRRRREVTAIPARLTDLRACLLAASNVTELAKEEIADELEQSLTREMESLHALMGDDAKARSSRAYKAAVKEITDTQKQRERRRTNDVTDRCLMDLVSVYRDVIAVQTGSTAGPVTDLVNGELEGDVRTLARRTTPESNLRRIDAIFAARRQILEFNTAPQLALESLMMGLKV
ncbi:MAG: DNA polymerase III subunit delta' [Nocardioidaceae bacterium]